MTHTTEFIGIDVSTGGVEIGVRSADGQEACASVDIPTGTTWRGDPEMRAFAVHTLADHIRQGLEQLEAEGWAFQPAGPDAAVSFAVRQHDLVLTRDDGGLLLHGLAIGWQCNAATAEVEELRAAGVEQQVGRIEPRFVLPKLNHILHREPGLRDEIFSAQMTGDWLAWMLTGRRTLSTSDAISNGLLVQTTKQLAADALQTAGLEPGWFPEVVQSGTIIGTVQPSAVCPEWQPVCDRLQGWSVVAGLGDNHATGVGCGLADESIIVVSAGNSGTVNRLCSHSVRLRGEAACFEFYDRRMLLMMLPDCAVWYDRFRDAEAAGLSHAEMSRLAESADPTSLQPVRQRAAAGGFCEVYPDGWSELSLATRIASTQASIAAALVRLVARMLDEVTAGAHPISRFVLTGGLSQSSFFQQAFAAGIAVVAGSDDVQISDRSGKPATQTAAFGALLNAMLPGRYAGRLEDAIARHCPRRPIADGGESRKAPLQNTLRRFLQD